MTPPTRAHTGTPGLRRNYCSRLFEATSNTSREPPLGAFASRIVVANAKGRREYWLRPGADFPEPFDQLAHFIRDL
jgi:hypothetical protein